LPAASAVVVVIVACAGPAFSALRLNVLYCDMTPIRRKFCVLTLGAVSSSQSQKARKGEPFSVRFTLSTDRLVQEEASRTRRSKSAIVELLTEEAARARRFAGIGFRGDDATRRPWVIGSGLDVWEIVQMHDDFGSIERLVAETQLTERQVRLALAYRDSYPEEVAQAIAQNRRSAEAWHELYPFVAFSTTTA
jgi:uncharacterized protein (DUF433 family)